MRWLRYGAICVLAVLLGTSPFRGIDISDLIPVEAVWIGTEGKMVRVETDTGYFGVGADVSAAVADLMATAPGKVFLDTADYLIVEKGEEKLLEQIYAVLRPSCMVCRMNAMPDLEAAVEFLKTHEPHTTLRQWKVDSIPLPVLIDTEGRFAWHAG